MTTIRKHIKTCIKRNEERNRRLKILLEALPNLDQEIDLVNLANDEYERIIGMGIDRFLREEMDVNSMALRRILGC